MISALIEFLAAQYAQCDSEGMLVTTCSILTVIPDDLVALQFMGLAHLQLGQQEKAISVFRKAASLYEANPHYYGQESYLPAASITYREATRPELGLGEGWRRIAITLERHGLNRLAGRARSAFIASQTDRTSNNRYKSSTIFQEQRDVPMSPHADLIDTVGE